MEERNIFHDLQMDLRRTRHEYGIMERIRADKSFGSPGIKVIPWLSSRGGDEDEEGIDEAAEDEDEDIPLERKPTNQISFHLVSH